MRASNSNRIMWAKGGRIVALTASAVALAACAEQVQAQTPSAPAAQTPATPGTPASPNTAAPPIAGLPTNAVSDASAKGPYDVIIVGAGMAGLTAAKTLRHAGRKVLVLEATNRIGGRGHVDATSFKVPLDLGGAWIHGAGANPLTPIINGMGFKRQETNLFTWPNYFTKDHWATPAEQQSLKKAFEAFEESLAESAAPDKPGVAPKDDAASNHLPKGPNKELIGLVASNAGPLESGAELSKTSSIDAAQFASGDDDFLERGYGEFVVAWGQEVLPSVRLDSPVTKISYEDPKKVVVETKKGEQFEGRKVLVTVSTGVLASTDDRNKITFQPELPADKRDAIKSLPMGLLNKVVLQFKTDAAPCGPKGTKLVNAWVLFDGPGAEDMAFVLRPLGANIAVGFYGGDRAVELERKGKDAMVDVATKAMSKMCGRDLTSELEKSAVTMWNSNPWTFGSYSSAVPGAVARKVREKLAEPVKNVVYFAGEACYNATYNGSFAAAYNSALQAGYTMIDCLVREEKGEVCQ